MSRRKKEERPGILHLYTTSALPRIPYMDSPALVGPGGAASLSPTSPVSIRSIGGLNGVLKRKRSVGGVIGAMDSSPGSIGDENDIGDHNDRKRQPGVKRACNECRQQKVSHAVSPTNHNLPRAGSTAHMLV